MFLASLLTVGDVLGWFCVVPRWAKSVCCMECLFSLCSLSGLCLGSFGVLRESGDRCPFAPRACPANASGPAQLLSAGQLKIFKCRELGSCLFFAWNLPFLSARCWCRARVASEHPGMRGNHSPFAAGASPAAVSGPAGRFQLQNTWAKSAHCLECSLPPCLLSRTCLGGFGVLRERD